MQSDLSDARKITSELLCTIASTETLGTCPGDSGGPLVHYDEDTDKNFQIGVVFGSLAPCDDRLYPSLYARLDDYDVLSFIRNAAFDNTIPLPEGWNGKEQTYLKYGFCNKVIPER